MIDINEETVVPLSRAARQWVPPARGRTTSPSTLWRWASKGVKGHRLDVVRIGGVAMTSREALLRFFAALSNQPAPAMPPIHANAQNALAAAGLPSAIARTRRAAQ